MLYPLHPLTLVLGVMTGCLGAFLAQRRGKNPYTWFFIGFFFGLLGAFTIFFSSKPKKEQSPLPIPTIEGPKNKLWFYVNQTNEQIGPVSYLALSSLWKEGTIQESTYVWHESLTEWTHLKHFIK